MGPGATIYIYQTEEGPSSTGPPSRTFYPAGFATGADVGAKRA